MFDAEIAATLQNRWHSNRAHPGEPSPLELLQEGKLHSGMKAATSTRTILPQARVFALNA